jgi:hypothetical protein
VMRKSAMAHVMMIELSQSERSATVAKPQAHRRVCDVFFGFLKIVALSTLILPCYISDALNVSPSRCDARKISVSS